VALRSLGLAACVALGATTLRAGGDASLELQVVDASGRKRAQASADLSAADGTGASYTAHAGRGGALAFYDVPPGAYRLVVEDVGLAPASATLRLEADETAWLTAVLSSGEGSSRIDGLVVDTGGYGTTFGAEALRDLPSSRDAWSLLETAETSSVADRIDGGGLWTGQAARFAAHGGSYAESSFRLGDADVTDPFGSGAPLLRPDLDGLAGLVATTALVPPEDAGSGPRLLLLPPRPGNFWRGTLQGAATTAGLQAAVPAGPPAIARYDSWRRGAFSLGGPLAGDRLGIALAGSATAVSRLERDEADAREGRARSLLAHIVWRGAPRQEAALLALVQDARRPEPARALFGDRALRQDAFTLVQGSWRRASDSGALLKLTAAYARARSSAEGRGGTTVGTVEPLSDGPIADALLDGPGHRQRVEGSLTARAAPRRWGPALQFFSLGLETAATRAELAPSGAVTAAELVGGVPARVWEFGRRDAASRWSATELAAHLGDRVRLTDRLLVQAEGRLESTRAESAAGSGHISWLTLSPRLHARLRLDGSGRLALFGGWGRLRHRLPLRLLAFGDPTAPAALVSRWLDDGDRSFTATERGPAVAQAGPGASGSSIDPGLAAPRTDELVAGLEARLGGRATVRLTGIHRRGRRLVESVNVGAPAAAYRSFTVPDPAGDLLNPADDQQLPIYDRLPASFLADRSVLTNPPAHTTLNEAVELVLELRPARGLEVRVGATAHRSDGSAAGRGFRPDENDPGLPGERFDDPNADTFGYGRLFFDRAYTIKIAAWYHHRRRGPRLGAVARYQDGQPFARLVLSPGLEQGAEAVRAIPDGRSRFAYTFTLDARAEQGLGLGRTRLSAVVEGFNLLGTAHEVEEDVFSGPGYRIPIAQQPPRAVRLGLRLDF